MPDPLWREHRFRVAGAAVPLHQALADAIPGLSRAQARRAVVAGLVSADGHTASASSATVVPGTAIVADLRHGVDRAFQARRHGGNEANARPFEVLHQDQYLVVVDKAPGVLSAPTRRTSLGVKAERGAVPELLRRMWKAQGLSHGYIGVVHRLDRDTSGCIVYARAREAQRILGAQFAGEAAGRTYRCIVWNQPRGDTGVVAGAQGRDSTGRRAIVAEEDEAEDAEGKQVETRWRVLRRFRLGAELEVELGTGRTHQIRVAMAHLGCPVIGDRVYGIWPRAAAGLPPDRLLLHAARLTLDHPGTGRRLVVEAPDPPAFDRWRALLDQTPPRA
jgi:23S rRNA pseudouridine1911/1915/1917 synthase